ncbi:MAG: hypothetical protein ABIE42_06685 [Candidatus Eisenbacteria bacterium]
MYYLSAGVQAAQLLDEARAGGMSFGTLGDSDGIAEVWAPQRFKRSYAAEGEVGVPYLKPYDVFEYLPLASAYLSVKRTKKLRQYQLQAGLILQSCSGRNLGPASIVDDYLAKFVLSHDMIRVRIADAEVRLNVLAYLQTQTAQHLVRRDKTGSVIDHISGSHLEAQHVPLLETRLRREVAEAMGRAVALREEARLGLAAAQTEYEDVLPNPTLTSPLRAGWSVQNHALGGRLDAAYHDPLVEAVRSALLSEGGVRVRDVAEVRKPGGRYKTVYVDSDYGRPILSGRQILQLNPVNLQHISPRALKDVGRYELRSGWTAYQADGRAEGGLGTPVLVTTDRDGWLASGHVGRLVPKSDIDSGWLYLAIRTWHAQVQLKSKASGSVVDSTFEADMGDVVLPPPSPSCEQVKSLWSKFVDAEAASRDASDLIESALREAAGRA